MMEVLQESKLSLVRITILFPSTGVASELKTLFVSVILFRGMIGANLQSAGLIT
jgi:hypothetical protein